MLTASLAATPVASALLAVPHAPPTAAATPLVHADLPTMLADLHDIDGPRVAGTPSLLAAAKVVQGKLDAMGGWKTTIERADSNSWSGRLTLYNVVAEKAGTAPAQGGAARPLVVAGAHLDTVRSAPGGNDDGTGSAALLAVARSLSATPTRNDVKLVWFDGEEEGLLGSKAYVRAHGDDTKRTTTMLEAEMLGSPHGAPVLLFAGKTPAGVAAPLVDAAKALSVPVEVATERPYGSDHNSFGDAGMPAMVFSTTAPIGPDPEGRIHHDDPAYHSSADTIAHIDTAQFGRTADVFASAVRAYADQAPTAATASS